MTPSAIVPGRSLCRLGAQLCMFGMRPNPSQAPNSVLAFDCVMAWCASAAVAYVRSGETRQFVVHTSWANRIASHIFKQARFELTVPQAAAKQWPDKVRERAFGDGFRVRRCAAGGLEGLARSFEGAFTREG